MTETSKSITMDQYDRFTLPLGKAVSILELAIEDMSPDAANCVDAAQDIIREAKQMVRGWVENDTAEKPAAPVMAFGEPIPDLEKELIAVMREMTKELEDVVVTGRGFLNDIDKRDKAAAIEAPGGES